MNPLWLLIIVPCSVFFGFVIAAIFNASGDYDGR